MYSVNRSADKVQRIPSPKCAGGCCSGRRVGCTGPTGTRHRPLRSSWPRRMAALSLCVQAGQCRVSRLRRSEIHFQNEPVVTPAEPAQPIHAETQSPSPQPAAASAVPIPESLKMQVHSASMRSVAERITPSLLAALEPVALSEDLSRRLLLQKVLPNYPERAVKARLQGPVVLQAWIGRDGTIQDLKLVRG